MPELTNLLRQRFASIAEPEVHPDADILTAYVEQLLATRERKNVMEHLAACGQCREVVLLLGEAQPVTADSAVPAAPSLQPKHTARAFSWRAWRSWRSAWGLAASLAGLAIVSTLIVEMPRSTMQVKKFTGNPTQASSPTNSLPATPTNEPARTDSVSSASNRLADAENTPARERDGRTTTSLQGGLSAETRAVAKSSPVTVAGGPYVNVEMFTNDANYVVPLVDLPSAPPPRVSSQAQNGLLSSIPLSASAPAPYEISTGKTLRIMTPNSGSGHMLRWSLVTSLGKDATKQVFRNHMGAPIAAYRITDSAMIHPGLFTSANELGPSEASAPSGNENGRGELARSGAFTARALASASSAEVSTGDADRVAGVRPAWKIADGKLLKLGNSGSWTEPYPAADGIEFSVVTNWGSDVWAGGNNAAVVHSRDGGASWERITLGASATGTIAGIEASGLKIVVRSSSGQSWLSADGGKSWTLQD
jgi:hypothetical protein